MRQFFLILGLLSFFCSAASAQATTQSAFVGTCQFNGFTASGPNVVGTLANFLDQTNLYFASDIQVGDVAWDNLGTRWEIVAVTSSNLVQAVVEMRNVNGTGGLPFGVGYVSRETPNIGLSMFPPDNSIGISPQLKSRVEGHNAILLDSAITALNGNQDTIADILKTVFVSKNNVLSGRKYSIAKPFTDVWRAKDSLSVGETMVIYPGLYSYSGPFGANPIADGYSLAKTDSTDFLLNGNVTLSVSGGSSSFYPMFSDVNSNFSSAQPRRFKIYGPNAQLIATKGSQSICIPFGFYNIDSELTADIDKIVSNGGRSWGFQVGCKRAFVNVNQIDVSGNIAFGIWRSLTATGEFTGVASRDIQLNVGQVTTQNQAEQNGIIRVQTLRDASGLEQPEIIDSSSFFRINVGNLKVTNLASTYLNVITSNFKSGAINFFVNNIDDFTVGDPTRLILAFGSVTGSNAIDTIYNSVVNVEVNKCVTGNSVFSSGQSTAFSFRGLYMDSTILNYKIGDLTLTNGSCIYDISNVNMLRGGALNFNCENCYKTAATAPFFVFSNNNSYSATSIVSVSGKYRIKGVSPLISIAQAAPIFLNNCFLYNDGGLLITSSVPVTIYIAGGSNVKVSDVSANVTLVYLPGGDGNGIYSGSGTIPNGTGATLLGTFAITTPGGAGIGLNQAGNAHYLGQSNGTRVQVNPTTNTIDLHGNGTDPANVHFKDANGDATIILAADDIVNGGGYKVTLPADAPADGESLVYNGSGVYDWRLKDKIVRFMPGSAAPFPISTTFPAYQLLGSFNSTQNTAGFTVASNIDYLYTGSGAKTFVLRFTASGDTASGLPVEFSYEINSSGKVVIATELSANFSVAGQAFVTMNTGDTLRFYVRPTSGALTANITSMSGSLEEF